MNIYNRFSESKCLISFSKKHDFHAHSAMKKRFNSSNHSYIYIKCLVYILCDVVGVRNYRFEKFENSSNFTDIFFK